MSNKIDIEIAKIEEARKDERVLTTCGIIGNIGLTIAAPLFIGMVVDSVSKKERTKRSDMWKKNNLYNKGDK